ncbi:HlyD family efflux transporter periplasmic adaptor subunit [Stieleria sp. TO1_6]|uniref:HlyD family secretion protein n=1 Tax=Stieleria tagensis TaxID=2956795 RepID=UPI00209A7997|nr:HlyD family efflux transporter periplasmic adaptor subunit [Stieleria tagensis]MCO8123038.1 HlyD family efflux transporter periplasmic adaptor subunit [Stieleria tagensis]
MKNKTKARLCVCCIAAMIGLAAISDGSAGPPIDQDANDATPNVVGQLVIKLIDQVEVPALQPGALESVAVRVGQTVQKGQALAQIDDRNSVALRSLAEVDLAISRRHAADYKSDRIADTERLEKQAALKQQRLLAKISQAKSENEVRVSAAEKAEAVAKNEWSRAAQARQKFVDSVSESEIDNLRLKYERSQLERIQAEFELRMDRLTSESESHAVQAAQLAADRAQLQHTVAMSESKQLQLDVDAKQKTLQMRDLNVAMHAVVSPIDGVVVEVYRRRGEWVRPGDPVVRVVNVDRLHAEGFLSGDVLPQRDQQVRLSSADKQLTGRIEFVDPERDSVSGEVRFLVGLDGGTFLPGDRVDIHWQVD